MFQIFYISIWCTLAIKCINCLRCTHSGHYRILVKYLSNHKLKETLKIKTKQREYLLNLVQGMVNVHQCICSSHTWYYSIIGSTFCSFNTFIQYVDDVPCFVLDTGDKERKKTTSFSYYVLIKMELSSHLNVTSTS